MPPRLDRIKLIKRHRSQSPQQNESHKKLRSRPSRYQKKSSSTKQATTTRASTPVLAHQPSPFEHRTEQHHPNYGDESQIQNRSDLYSSGNYITQLGAASATYLVESSYRLSGRQPALMMNPSTLRARRAYATPVDAIQSSKFGLIAQTSCGSSSDTTMFRASIGFNSAYAHSDCGPPSSDTQLQAPPGASGLSYKSPRYLLRGIDDKTDFDVPMGELGDEIDAQARASNVSTEARIRERMASREDEMKRIEMHLDGASFGTGGDQHTLQPPSAAPLARTRSTRSDTGNDGDEEDGLDSVPCPWPNCNHTGNPQRTKEHLRRNHLRCYQCKYCHFRQGDSHQIKRHQKKIHPNVDEGYNEVADNETTWLQFQSLKSRKIDLKAVCSAQTPAEVRAVPGFVEPAQWPGTPASTPADVDDPPDADEDFARTLADRELQDAVGKWKKAWIITGKVPDMTDVLRIIDLGLSANDPIVESPRIESEEVAKAEDVKAQRSILDARDLDMTEGPKSPSVVSGGRSAASTTPRPGSKQAYKFGFLGSHDATPNTSDSFHSGLGPEDAWERVQGPPSTFTHSESSPPAGHNLGIWNDSLNFNRPSMGLPKYSIVPTAPSCTSGYSATTDFQLSYHSMGVVGQRVAVHSPTNQFVSGHFTDESLGGHCHSDSIPTTSEGAETTPIVVDSEIDMETESVLPDIWEDFVPDPCHDGNWTTPAYRGFYSLPV